MTKRLDPDFVRLKAADKAIRETSPRMRRVTLDYLVDKYLIHRPKWLMDLDAAQPEEKTRSTD